MDCKRDLVRPDWLVDLEDKIRMSVMCDGKFRNLGAVLLLAAALTGCGSASVVRKSGSGASGKGATVPRTSVARVGEAVTVKQGDTLYAISRRTGIAPQDLAAWNGLSSSATIYPGQRLHLYPASSAATTATKNTQSAEAATTPTVAAAAPINSGISWRWPADGGVVGKYVAGEATKQGVDIAGVSGQAVRATADGVVVYSGAGLVGYGELIIVKHNDQWLSAYGHNRKRLVNEGQSVKAGQQIAEMGRSGATRDMLHFEIRYNGKPVDPLLYLPKK
jgi:lipoprotein NlpD